MISASAVLTPKRPFSGNEESIYSRPDYNTGSAHRNQGSTKEVIAVRKGLGAVLQAHRLTHRTHAY